MKGREVRGRKGTGWEGVKRDAEVESEERKGRGERWESRDGKDGTMEEVVRRVV